MGIDVLATAFPHCITARRICYQYLRLQFAIFIFDLIIRLLKLARVRVYLHTINLSYHCPVTLGAEHPMVWLWHGLVTWWRHQIETFSALLAICAGNSLVTGESPHKGQWRGALIYPLIYAWMNDWVNDREAGDLRRHRAHYDVTVMSNCRFLTSMEIQYAHDHTHHCILMLRISWHDSFCIIISACIKQRYSRLEEL